MAHTGLVAMKALEVMGVSKTYSIWRHKVKALDGVNISIPEGYTVGLVGPNGAGKSTLLKIIMGFLKEDSGIIKISSKKPPGYVPEFPTFINDLTVYDNIKYITELAGVGKEKIESLLKEFGIYNKKNVYPHELSNGQKKRLAIVRAIITDPEIIIMDEPFSGLDPTMAIDIKNKIKGLKDGRKTILISSHNLQYLSDICDRFVFMNAGKVIRTYDPNENSIILRITYSGDIPEKYENKIKGHGTLIIETEKDKVPSIIYDLVQSGVKIYEAKIEGLDTIYERTFLGGEKNA